MDLRDYLSIHEIDPPTFAGTINVTAASVYRYLAGDRLPRPAVMARIAAVTHGAVQPNDFFGTATAPTPQPATAA